MSQHTPKDSHYARLRRQYRDRQAPSYKQPNKDMNQKTTIPATKTVNGQIHLYGFHTVEAALKNPARRAFRLYCSPNAFKRLNQKEASLPCPLTLTSPKELDRLVGSDAVHQGIILETEPLKPRALSALSDTNLVLLLDQITDPHNVGAILRSAVAFKAGALITTHRHSSQESGVLAKSASGALEMIDHISVRNLSETLNTLHEIGFISIGLDSEGPCLLEKSLHGKKIALILGAEGRGLRQKTRTTASRLARLDMPGLIKSLNVSNAAAIALYATHNYLRGQTPPF
ncbi:TrmH family RNA methyltransferase [Bartonella sp. DGB2]|uniref:TrmH family RNA methyltransferase n=1 Tax=Bartonella sp. DGB2 TaxID=3388426 RepID=UPI00398F9C11